MISQKFIDGSFTSLPCSLLSIRTHFITEGLGLINEVVAVVSYFSVLWSLSTFTLSFSLFGASIEIPGYMVWIVPLYVLLASVLTHVLGTPLRKLNDIQQKREAGFHFSLAHVRKSWAGSGSCYLLSYLVTSLKRLLLIGRKLDWSGVNNKKMGLAP